MKALRIIEPGLLATVQDRGRFGYRDRGVPVCGAMDRQAFRLANLLAGNPSDLACIEITLGGFVARFEEEARFALTGADTRARLGGRNISAWRRHFARKGEVLVTEPPATGLRTYLGVSGGIEVSPVMGSRSTFLMGGLGGLAGRALKKGDLLSLGEAAGDKDLTFYPELPPELIPAYSGNATLRVLPGPQVRRLSARGLKTFFASEYTVSSRSDRMGSILSGPAVELDRGADIVSEGAWPGAVQVPGNGRPVILGNDCQTTGGYVKAASVIEVDLSLAAQLAPGATVRFAQVGLDEARLAYLKNEYMLQRLYEKRFMTGGGK